MRKQHHLARTGLAIAAAAAMTTAAFGAAAQTPAPEASCFTSRDWNGWSSPSPDILYLKIRHKDVYRVDLQGSSSRIDRPGAFLVSVVRGSARVCSPVDLDLKVSDSSGFVTPLFPTAITRLTAEEVAAIPPKYRP